MEAYIIMEFSARKPHRVLSCALSEPCSFPILMKHPLKKNELAIHFSLLKEYPLMEMNIRLFNPSFPF